MAELMRRPDDMLARCADGRLARCPTVTGCDGGCTMSVRYKITFASLAGDYAQFNGENTVVYVSGCTWVSGYYPSNRAILTLYRVPTGAPVGDAQWYINMLGADTASGCAMVWLKDAVVRCSPVGGYSVDSCSDNNCSDGDSCEDSAGATCIVSEVS